MKIKILILACMLLFSTAEAQLISDLPKDINGQLYKSEIVEVEGMPKDDMFSAFSQLFADMFVRPEMATHLSDKETGIIVIKSYDKVSNNFASYQLWFSMKVECRDNRYKIELYDFFYKTTSLAPQNEISYYLSPKKYYKKDGTARKLNEALRKSTVDKIDEILAIVRNNLSKYKQQEW